MNWLIRATLLVALTLSGGASAEEYDLAYYQEIFAKGNRTEQIKAAGSLEWAGLSDPVLFDLVKAKLDQVGPTAKSKGEIDYASWLLKALAFSGNEQYRAVLEEYSEKPFHKKLRKYAKQGQVALTQHSHWNPVISNPEHFDAAQSLKVNRLANMLRSDQMELKRIAAKRIHFEHLYDPYLLALLAERLQQEVPEMAGDKLTIDTYAWMAKALAGSAEPEYRPLIENLAETAPERKLQRYAKKYLNYF